MACLSGRECRISTRIRPLPQVLGGSVLERTQRVLRGPSPAGETAYRETSISFFGRAVRKRRNCSPAAWPSSARSRCHAIRLEGGVLGLRCSTRKGVGRRTALLRVCLTR